MQCHDALKEFVVTHHQLAEVRQQRSAAAKARRAALARVLEYVTALPAVQAAMAARERAITVPLLAGEAQYTATLRARGGFKPGSSVSDAALEAAMEGVTEADMRDAAAFLCAKQARVPAKQVIAHAVLRALARLAGSAETRSEYKLTLKAGAGADTRESAVVDAYRPPGDVAAALAAATAPDELAPRAKELAAKDIDLSAMLQTSLRGADRPDYVQPLTVNMEGDARQSYLLRASTRTKKPAVTGARVLEFVTAAQHDLLDATVTATTVDAAGLRALTQRLAPAIRAAIRQWQAQHAQTTSRLRITAKGQ
jgi:DNA polymerase III delta prime subunit